MRDVYVAGVGMTAFGKFMDRSVRVLAEDATAEALADAGAGPGDVDTAFVANAVGRILTGQEMIRGLLRTKAGDRAISAKRREAMDASIDEFVDKAGLTGKEAVVTGNIIRSFAVHNGIFIQGRAWRGKE